MLKCELQCLEKGLLEILKVNEVRRAGSYSDGIHGLEEEKRKSFVRTQQESSCPSSQEYS